MSETKPVVLVVEDELPVRLFAEEIPSEDGGYRVITATHAGVLMILDDRPDVRLVFTDINDAELDEWA